MVRLIKNKKARAAAIPLPRPRDPLSEFAKSMKQFGRAFKEEALTRRKELSARAAGAAAARKTKSVFWMAFISTELHNVATILREIFKPAIIFGKWFFSRVLALTQVWVAIMLVVAIWFGGGLVKPVATVYAAENDLHNVGDWYNHVTQEKLGLSKFKQWMDEVQRKWNYTVYGQFAEPYYGADRTRYGVYIDSGKMAPLKTKFYKDEQIVVFANPKAVILTGVENENVEISCELEDGTLISDGIKPMPSIPLKDISGSTIVCIFEPIPIDTDPTREASITLNYEFQVTATLPVGVMDELDYNPKYISLLSEHDHNPVSTKNALAESLGIDPDQKAETKRTPLEIGAAITEPQPLIQGEEQHPSTLLVTVINVGEGTARIDGMTIDTGEQGLGLEDIGVPIDKTEEGYGVKMEFLQGIREPLKDFQSFIFGVNTAGFSLDGGADVTSTRMTIIVDYTYNITAKKDVRVATCNDYPAAPECIVVTEGEAENETIVEPPPGTTSPIGTPPAGHDSRRGPYVEFTGAGQVGPTYIGVYTGEITQNQGGAAIPFKARPGETLKSITEEIAARYNLDPALLAAIEAEETGMHFVNRDGELCKPEDTGQSYLTGCGAYTSCVCGNSPNCQRYPECLCDSPSLYSDRTQIECTANALRDAYDDSMAGRATQPYGVYCRQYNSNPNNVWVCIFCKYAGQSTLDFTACKWDDQIINYYKIWKKAYSLGEFS